MSLWTTLHAAMGQDWAVSLLSSREPDNAGIRSVGGCNPVYPPQSLLPASLYPAWPSHCSGQSALQSLPGHFTGNWAVGQ